MKEQLEYEPIQCILCFKDIAFIAMNNEPLKEAGIIIDDIAILCQTCKEKTDPK